MPRVRNENTDMFLQLGESGVFLQLCCAVHSPHQNRAVSLSTLTFRAVAEVREVRPAVGREHARWMGLEPLLEPTT
ncbi:hypothetical protein SRHO_G00044340 [Serrasalmus rhombeus]